MKIIALNPNSSRAVTQSMRRCLGGIAALSRHDIVCTEIADAPEGIESDADVATVAPMVEEFVRGSGADAFIVACFSDPGVERARRAAGGRPVIGIAEAAYYGALQHGARFGVISLGPASIARHAAHIERLGLTSRLAGDRAIAMGVAEANDRAHAEERVGEVGAALIEEDGADVVILGCAGMGEQRDGLQARLQRIVIDPVQAAVTAAITALDLNYRTGH